MKKNVRTYYEKPKLNKVRLEIEEAVLTACKRSDGSGGKTNKCSAGGGGCKTGYGS